MGRSMAVGGLLALALSVGAVSAGAKAYAGTTGAPTPVPSTTTTLPALPQVDTSITDGEPEAQLLANALALSSSGAETGTLLQTVVSAQQRLDGDAAAAASAAAAAAAAQQSEQQAERAAASASSALSGMQSQVRQALLSLYTAGGTAPQISAAAGYSEIYADDYLDSALSPYGVLAKREATIQTRNTSLAAARRDAAKAADEAQLADHALAAQKTQVASLRALLAGAGAGSPVSVASDHLALAQQAAQELSPTTPLLTASPGAAPAPLATTNVALTWAFSELGKPYTWGATGPDTFDCSGLTQYVWEQAGVSIPRVAADQDAWTVPVTLAQLLPGDLVFFGTTDIHHVGIYIGDGLMINAPHTGDVVRVSSIWWSDLAGFGRVHSASVPVPAHAVPTAATPAPRSVVGNAAPVPSQVVAPQGWTPSADSTSPISDAAPADGSTTTTSTTDEPTTTTSTTEDPYFSSTTTTVPDPSTTTTVDPDPTTTTTVAGVDGASTGG